MRDFVFTYALFSSMLFFSLAAILGIDYSSVGGGGLFQYYSGASSVIVIIVFFMYYVRQKITSRNVITFLIIALYFFSGILSGFWRDSSFLRFAVFCIPASFIGLYYGNLMSIDGMIKWLDLVKLILTIALLFLSRRLSLAIAQGDSYYSQTLSYYAAMGFLLDLYLLDSGNGTPRFSFFCSKIVRFIDYLLLFLYPVVILYSGGRGGFITLIVGLLVYVLFINKTRNGNNVLLSAFLMLCLIGLFAMIFDISSYGFLSEIQHNSARVFSYVSSGSIDISETSGRDFVYSRSIDLIGANPFGYGLYSYKKVFMPLVGQRYPHNLFLEWLMQGGVIFFLVWMVSLVLLIRKMIRINRVVSLSYLFIPFLIYPLVQLLFSASYVEEPFFWFSFCFMVNCKNKNKLLS